MIKSLVGGVAASALVLTLGAGIASADDRPVKGTLECASQVNGQADVVAARTAVRSATDTLNVALRATPIVDSVVADARVALGQAQAHLRVVVGNVTNSLCQDAPETTTTVPPTTTVEKTSPPVVEQHTVEHRTVVEKVVPTVDDGSAATTSGGQVTVVPEGSASTGYAA